MTSAINSDQPSADILIVDDTISSLRALTSILTKYGYTVRGAPSGASALVMIEAAPPDLILLDVRMPKMDGYEVSQQLKADPQTANIPIIFISALDSLEDKVKGFEAGGVDYVTKPIQITEVLARVKTHLSLRQLQARLEIQNNHLQKEIAERHRAETALQTANEELDRRVAERTAELAAANTNLKAEMAEREQTEKKYQSLFEHAHDSIFIIDPVTRCILDVNENAARRLGYTREELLQLTIGDIDMPMTAARREAINQELQTNGSILFEHGHRCKNGTEMPVEISYRIVTLSKRQVIQSVVRDITVRKQQEKQLRQLIRAVEQSPAAIVITDLEGIIEYVNPRFTQMTGYALEEAIHQTPNILKSGHTSLEEYNRLWQTISDGGEWRGEILNRKKNGDLYWEFSSISPIIDEDGSITHYLAVKEDISERKRMADELQQRNRELTLINHVGQTINSSLALEKVFATMLEESRRLLGASACSVWLLDKETQELVCQQITDPHSEMMRGLRLSPGQGIAGWAAMEGKSLIVPDTHADERHFKGVDEQTGLLVRSILTVPLRTKQEIIGVFQVVDETADRFTDAELRLVESLAAAAANAIENAHLHEDLQRQLSRLKDTQARLVQSEKLAGIGELIAGVAHELNNPLASVLLYAQLLQSKGVNSEIHRDLDILATQARQANNVVRGLLDFARQRPPERIPSQINDILESVADLLAYKLRTNNINVSMHLSDQIPITMADPHQLQQVFVNLINNALQAMSQMNGGGQIALTTELGTSRFFADSKMTELVIRIIVQDTGPGIPPEMQSRIFDPFFTTKALGEGTGLGLSVCHGIVREHEGHIWIESKLGQGTTCFVELPIVGLGEPDMPSKPTLDQQDVEEDGSKSRILVIDDEASLLKIVTRILQRKGYYVDGASNGKEGLICLDKVEYDLILCDLRMPEMGGPEFYQHACSAHPEIVNRIIFTTGDTVSANTRQFLDQVDAPYLSKPVELSDLIAAVQEKLEENKVASQ